MPSRVVPGNGMDHVVQHGDDWRGQVVLVEGRNGLQTPGFDSVFHFPARTRRGEDLADFPRVRQSVREQGQLGCRTGEALGGRVSAAAAVSIRARIRAVVTAPLLRILESGDPAYDDARAGFHAAFLKCSLTRAAGSGRAWERSGAGPHGDCLLGYGCRPPQDHSTVQVHGRTAWLYPRPDRRSAVFPSHRPRQQDGGDRAAGRGPVDQFLRSQTLEQSAGRTRRSRPGHRRGGPVRSREVQGPGDRPSGGLSARWR
ncbi:hypothetical protein RKD38_000262 [Streptomyces ambofaciens]